jgi:hypothetical protein
MTEFSLPWSNENVGDGSLSPYDNDEWSDTWRKLFQRDRTLQGYIEAYENELLVSNPAGNTIRVATGAALVDGKFYETDANVDNAIATPAVSTRIDRVVLRKDFAAQTVRVVILTGVEGGGVPALTQTDGVTWEIPLAQVSITTAPAITISDERTPSRTPLAEIDTATMVLIENIIADGTDTTIDFQNIPQTYTHLLLIGQVRFAGAVVQANLEIRFNDDSGASYNDQQTLGENVTASAASATGANEGALGEVPGGSGIANHAGAFQSYVPNYRGTTFFKNWLGMSISIPNVTVAAFSMRHAGGQWDNTDAIERITVLSTTGASGNILAGSQISLYGIN